MKTLVLIASNTGNTKTFLDYITRNTKGELVICDDFSSTFENYSKIILGSYTWSDGKIPKKMKDHLINNHLQLDGKEVFIFGSGNSIYPHFCRAVESLKKICEDSGALVKGTYKFEQRFNEEDLSKEQDEVLSKILSKF